MLPSNIEQNSTFTLEIYKHKIVKFKTKKNLIVDPRGDRKWEISKRQADFKYGMGFID